MRFACASHLDLSARGMLSPVFHGTYITTRTHGPCELLCCRRIHNSGRTSSMGCFSTARTFRCHGPKVRMSAPARPYSSFRSSVGRIRLMLADLSPIPTSLSQFPCGEPIDLSLRGPLASCTNYPYSRATPADQLDLGLSTSLSRTTIPSFPRVDQSVLPLNAGPLVLLAYCQHFRALRAQTN